MKRTLVMSVTLMLATLHTLSAHPRRDTPPPADTLGEVVVLGRLIYREVVPAQKLGGEQLERLRSHSVADAMRYFSGIQLKDYGGVGGVKTVNVRSMGSHHLGIYYDGVELGNAQNGQIDLGQFSLDNVEEVSLYYGQKSAIFQTASDFAHAGSVYIRTRRPHFKNGETNHLSLGTRVGASGLFRLSSLLEHRLSQQVSSSLSAAFLTANGRYRFRYRRLNTDGTTAWDTTATRHNGDLHAERVELNVNGQLDEGYWQLKGYVYNSERGIPGAVVNNVWRRGERQDDLNTFVQGAWQKSFGPRFSTRVLGKFAWYATHYVNRDSTQMPVDNTYWQQEVYLTTSNVYELLRGWSVSMSYDARWNKLNANLFRFARPRRWTHQVSLATGLDLRRLKVQGSVVSSSSRTEESLSGQLTTASMLTPSLSLAYTPSGRLSLRAFAKRSYRLPTFNDLYYTDLGNANLKPESALQYDAGLTLRHEWAGSWQWAMELKADAYYNSVHNKIVAYPKGQQFRWTMLNLGRVHIHGIDVTAQADCSPTSQLHLQTIIQYTYQDARDKTRRATSYYNDQIPYVPWHSGSLIAAATWRAWTLNYSFIYTGERYSAQENIIYNHVEPWYTSDVSLSHSWQLGHRKLRAQLEVNNLLNQQYDVIVNYPMPGRNWAADVRLEF